MKKTVLSLIASFLIIAFVIPAQAATIYAPTPSGEIDINFLVMDDINTFAIFDDDDATFDNPLILAPVADTISLMQNGNDWDLVSTETGNTLTLTDSSQFMLAMLPQMAAMWEGNTSEDELAFGIYEVKWEDRKITISMIDAVPAVPLPASFLLLGSGFIGLVGFRRMFSKP
jgi:hypothetical protein